MRIGLVFGGHTTEGEVSKNTALMVRGALGKLGYEVVDIEFNKNVPMSIQDANVDVIFNAMHGQYGEDGSLQGLLDIMQIPYTHSGKLASAMTMNKNISNKLFASIGIPVIKGLLISKEDLHNDLWKEKLKNSELGSYKEIFIKPVQDGSSRDAFLVKNIDDFSFKTIELMSASEQFLIQERIIGREIQVAVLRDSSTNQDKAIGMLEICPNAEFFDYNAKYSANGAIHKPVEIDENIKNKILEYAEQMHNILGLRYISRSEFLLTNDNKIYALEVNSHPGLTNESIFPDIAKNVGINYEDIIEILIKNAKFD